MSTKLTNAKIIFGGVDLSGQSNKVELDYQAEKLDSTTFGSNTRTYAGGLKITRATGGGFFLAGTVTAGGIHNILYEWVGMDDEVLALFPNGITEGSTSTGSGYAFKAMEGRYTIGGEAGELLPFAFEAEGRGIQGVQG